jgi:cysteine-rich repeat protein
MRRICMGEACLLLASGMAAVSGCLIEGESLPDIIAGQIGTSSAPWEYCGDGVRKDDEACDDGNDVSGDGCDPTCAIEPCAVCMDPLGGPSQCGSTCDAAAGEVCWDGACASCADGAQNGGETGVDCGGRCASCLGEACADGASCASGHCADGVCCTEACTDDCMSCNAAGVCTGVANGEEDGACAGASTCDGQGACKKNGGEACVTSKECLSLQCIKGRCL